MEYLKRVIEEGKKYIFEDRKDEWEQLCVNNWNDIFDKMVLEDSVEAMQLLSESSLSYEEIMEIVDKMSHSTITWEMLENIVSKFHPKGEQFVKSINGNSLAKQREKFIQEISKKRI